MSSKVSIVILNWNGWKDTIECLESLYNISYPNYNVILVENGSKDSSLQCIKSYLDGNLAVSSPFFVYSAYNKPIKIREYTRDEALLGGGGAGENADLTSNKRLVLIKNDVNSGFAEGCNIAMRYALDAQDPDYILLLNNDTVVHKDFLGELVKVAENGEEIGFVGPKVYYYNRGNRSDVISVAGSKLDMLRSKLIRIGSDEIDRGQYNRIAEVDYVEGSCLLVKSKLLREIGLLNSRYFAYWEETDLCRRGAEAGYKSLYVPQSLIWHKIGSSSSNPFRLYHMTRNRLWFMRAHAKGKDLALFLIYFFCYSFFLSCGVYIRRKDRESLQAFLRGVLDGVIHNGR